MSFHCARCGDYARADFFKGGKAFRVVVERREKLYPFRSAANRFEPTQNRRPDDPGGKGWEIVKEILVCEACK